MSRAKKGAGGKDRTGISRRQFLKITGVVVAGAGAGTGIVSCGGDADGEQGGPGDAGLCGVVTIPLSEGYLVVDSKKCQGCLSCMIACSLVHEGQVRLTRSRIQILQNSFESWPDDLTIEQCRQCVEPACVQQCPTWALHADEENGGVRLVDRDKCTGWGGCADACPFTPERTIVVEDEAYDGDRKGRKCDLCIDAPYLCDAEGNPAKGGPGGMQACVAVCPVGAIAFTTEVPEQEGDEGYKVNLRDEVWGTLGFPTE